MDEASSRRFVRFPNASGKLIKRLSSQQKTMRRKLLVGCTAVTMGMLLLFVPIVPSNAVFYSGPSITPPMNHWVLSDPSGTYSGIYLGNGTYSMNNSAYQRLLHDPYTVAPTSNVKVEGNTVYIFAPSSESPPHGIIAPPVPTTNDFESVTSLFLGHGGMLANGNYFLR